MGGGPIRNVDADTLGRGISQINSRFQWFQSLDHSRHES